MNELRRDGLTVPELAERFGHSHGSEEYHIFRSRKGWTQDACRLNPNISFRLNLGPEVMPAQCRGGRVARCEDWLLPTIAVATGERGIAVVFSTWAARLSRVVT